MGLEPPVPETSVLAVASHVVSGHVGNKIAVFVLQSMGCDVAALNTVQFSNHTGYRQVKGTKLAANEITDLWDGLKQSHLDDFDMMLSGYVPGAAGVEAVGAIARELRENANAAGRPSSFFWVLDPVMGDNGKMYVADDVLPIYQGLLPHADLILPNQFEAWKLSGVEIIDEASLERAIEVLHKTYRVPHVVITSVSLPISKSSSRVPTPSQVPPEQSRAPTTPTMSVVGSTMTSDGRPRLFTIQFTTFQAYFSGTGDMFAALMVVRMREAVIATTPASITEGAPQVPLRDVPSWISPDEVPATELPLAKAAAKVLGSMHGVLERTYSGISAELEAKIQRLASRRGVPLESVREDSASMHLLRSAANELKIARNLDVLSDPDSVIVYTPEEMGLGR